MRYYVVEGGVGKHIAFTALIDKLAKDGKISIISSYPEIFFNNPRVESSYALNEAGLYDRLDRAGDIIYREPYYSPFLFGKTHLLQEWGNLLGIKYEGELPRIFLNAEAQKNVDIIRAELPEEFIIVQFGGGQSPYNAQTGQPFKGAGQRRAYPLNMAQEFINRFKELHPGVEVVNYALANEEYAYLQDCKRFDCGYLLYVGLLQKAKTFVGIDSSLQHMGAAANKPGIVIWGATGAHQFGYDLHINLSNTTNHHMRPLCRTLGDTVNADGSLWVDPDILSTAVPVGELIKKVEGVMACCV